MSGSDSLPDNWRTSSFTGKQPDCVEIADNAEVGVIQDTKNRGPKIVLPRASYDAFIASVRTRNE